MNRRAFITAWGGGIAVALPLALEAQPAGKAYRVGVLAQRCPCDASGLELFLALSLALAPLATEAQSGGKAATIGILAIEAFTPIDSFRQALRELGYVEGRDIRYEYP